MTKIARLSIALVLALALGFGTSVANAKNQGEPSAEDLEAAKKAYASGAEAFKKNNFEEAVKAFKESYRLSKNPILLYNIGYALDEAGDKQLALFYYKKFLSDTPKDAANRDVAKERALELTKEIAGKTDGGNTDGGNTDGGNGNGSNTDGGNTDGGNGNGNGSNSDGGKTDGGATANPTEFQHNIIDEVPPGKPIDVTAYAPKNVGWKVYLNYRAAGAAKFTRVEMEPRYAELIARIPARVVKGSSIQYFVEARDIGDEMVARSGKSTSPNLIIIEAGAKARYYPDFDGGNGDEVGPDLGGSSSGGSGRDDGPTDRMTYAKWGATGGAIGFIALSATFLAIASDASSSLEGVAVTSSQQDTCSQGRPCQPFSESERDLQARGKRFETLGNVFLGLGVAAGATAGVLWYLEAKSKKKNKDRTVTTTPAIGPDFVGAAATVRF